MILNSARGLGQSNLTALVCRQELGGQSRCTRINHIMTEGMVNTSEGLMDWLALVAMKANNVKAESGERF